MDRALTIFMNGRTIPPESVSSSPPKESGKQQSQRRTSASGNISHQPSASGDQPSASGGESSGEKSLVSVGSVVDSYAADDSDTEPESQSLLKDGYSNSLDSLQVDTSDREIVFPFGNHSEESRFASGSKRVSDGDNSGTETEAAVCSGADSGTTPLDPGGSRSAGRTSRADTVPKLHSSVGRSDSRSMKSSSLGRPIPSTARASNSNASSSRSAAVAVVRAKSCSASGMRRSASGMSRSASGISLSASGMICSPSLETSSASGQKRHRDGDISADDPGSSRVAKRGQFAREAVGGQTAEDILDDHDDDVVDPDYVRRPDEVSDDDDDQADAQYQEEEEDPDAGKGI